LFNQRILALNKLNAQSIQRTGSIGLYNLTRFECFRKACILRLCLCLTDPIPMYWISEVGRQRVHWNVFCTHRYCKIPTT